MLFVSNKEPLTSETLPDTSLHNVRKQQVHESNSLVCSRSTTFFQPPQACLSKLTKEQFGLHREFLRLGSLLMAENIDLFHNALTVLSAKHDLKTSTPATCVSDVIPPSQIARHYNKSGKLVASRASNRKYVLPKDIAEKEFYQCMVCKERRTTNSFAAHTHEESLKPCIRWYCPLCDSFYAVTHRGYHVKKCHSDVLIIAHSDSDVKQQESTPAVDPASLKRFSDRSSAEDESEVDVLSPPEKMQHFSSPSSFISAESVSSCSTNCDVFEEENSSSRSSVFLDSCQAVDQDAPLFNNEIDDDFSVFPSEQSNGDDLFASLCSPYSL